MNRTALFGTDGIRGRAGVSPLDPRTLTAIGHSLVGLLGAGATVIVGRDTRESGHWIESALSRGVADAGGRAISVGVITTPGVAFLTRELGGDAGVVISASHNPFYDNGIKIFTPGGQKLSDEMELAIAERLAEIRLPDDLQLPSTEVSAASVLPADPTPSRPYVDYLSRRLAELRRSSLEDRPGHTILDGLRLVIDCANGAATAIAPLVFSQLGAAVTVINAAPDGRNINQQCGALHTGLLQQRVVEESADLGLAFDGDADRLILVDRSGRTLDGDSILFILSTHLHRQRQLTGNRVVATIMSNFGLELALRNLGIDLVRTAVGDRYVLEELLRGGGAIGGEQSGHIIFPTIGLAGDGIVTAIEVLRVICETGSDLVELTSGLVRTPQVLINLPVERKIPLDSIPAVREALDDLRAELALTGRVVVRYSGTENIVRIMIEGTSETLINERANSLSRLLALWLNPEGSAG